MEGQFSSVIRQKISDSLATPPRPVTRRDIWVPSVPGKAVAVIGMRRAGKTSLLWQLLGDRLQAAPLDSALNPRDGLLYFSFEDERLAGLGANDLDALLELYFEQCPRWRDQHRVTWFLDEVQLVPGWERFARRVLDSENIELFISGSSARMLSREIATAMRGRAMEAVVYPFSFRECLRHAGQEPDRDARPTKSDRSELQGRLLDYLGQGGFPEAQGLDARTRNELLQSYVDVVLLRDIIERHGISQPLVLRWLVRQLLGNAAGNFSAHKFHADLRSQGIAVAKEAVHNHIAHLEDAFLMRSVAIETDSEARRRVNPRKTYPIDMGLSPIFDRSGKANLGHALETAVLLELERRGAQVSYVRAAAFEVDFLARHANGTQQLTQVCAEETAPAVRERELRALNHAAQDHPHAERLLIALDLRGWQVVDGVRAISALDWLLQSERPA